MASEDENCSDEEIFEDEWPEDFFEVENDENPPEVKQTEVKKTAFSDLPQDILRLIVGPLELKDRIQAMQCSRALMEAVGASKWSHLGNGKLIVSALEAKEKLFVHVTFGGLLTIKRLNEATVEVFPKVHRLFGKLYLKELRLNKVPINHDLLRSFHDFLEDCSFERLTIMEAAEICKTDKLQLLMDRARYEVVIETEHKMEKFVKRSGEKDDHMQYSWSAELQRRPVFYREEPTPMDTDDFMRRVRAGDNLHNVEVIITSVDQLEEVIEMVSSSRTQQKIDFWNIDTWACEKYVRKFRALEKHSEHTPYRGLGATQSFVHRGATIHLAKIYEKDADARIVVMSENYTRQPGE